MKCSNLYTIYYSRRAQTMIKIVLITPATVILTVVIMEAVRALKSPIPTIGIDLPELWQPQEEPPEALKGVATAEDCGNLSDPVREGVDALYYWEYLSEENKL
jgi:hypothetical protein